MLRYLSIFLFLAPVVLNAAKNELPTKLTAPQVATAVKNAPKVPVEVAPGQKLRLVDYIDCTNPDDPHDFIDQGTSQIIKSNIGSYRSTAAHRHAFFSYRFKAEKQDRPHIIVFEYPDDAERMICFFTHESRITGKYNHMWSLESGVYSGRAYPLTNKMQYHTFYFWPTDTNPAVIIANWNRQGAPAAASKIWIYAVDDGLQESIVSVPNSNHQRMIGTLHNWSLVPVRGTFGLTSHSTVFRNITDYYGSIGANLISWPVLSTTGWSRKCIVPAWGVTENAYDVSAKTVKGSDELDSILTACDATDIRFLPTFEMGFNAPLGGVKVEKGNKKDTNNVALRNVYKKGFKEFITRYGTHPSLYGLSFDTPDLSPKYGEAVLDVADQIFEGGIPEFVAYLKSLNPKLRIFTYLGSRSIHAQYFPEPWNIYETWEKGGIAWKQLLTDRVDSLWKSESWNRDPARLNKIKDLELMNQYQFDDPTIFEYYSQNPRAHMYQDLEESQEKSDLQDTRAAMLFNTFYEGYFGLDTNNYWYLKSWVAPDFNPVPPYALAAYALALQHRDRDVILAGSWNTKPAGQEMLLKPWITAFRSLPPVEMSDVKVPQGLPVKVRQAVYDKKNYVYALNTSPFEVTLTLTFAKRGALEKVTLAPFALKSFVKKKKQVLTGVKGSVPQNYISWIQGRIEEFDLLITELKKIDTTAVGPAYITLSKQVHALLKEKKYTAANNALGYALLKELRLRKAIIKRTQEVVPFLETAPKFTGDLALWPEQAVQKSLDSASNIAGHLYMPNAWSGADDFSGKLRYGYDSTFLYVGLQVTDNILTSKDDATFSISLEGYKKWQGDRILCDYSWKKSTPDSLGSLAGTDSTGTSFTVTRSDSGYTYELAIARTLLPKDKPFGFYLQFADYDNDPNTYSAGWARKTIMLYPNSPTFPYWEDARTCTEMILGK